MAAIADIRSKFKLKKKKKRKNWQKEKDKPFQALSFTSVKSFKTTKRNRLRTRFPGS